MADTSSHHLVCRAGQVLVALPLAHVAEACRPLPMREVRSGIPFVSGVAVIRGKPVPVVHLATLLGAGSDLPTRWLIVKTPPARNVALSVSEIVGVRELPKSDLGELPPLLSRGAREFVTQLGSLDREVLVTLESGRLLPDALWSDLAAGMP